MVIAARWEKSRDGVGTAQYIPGSVGILALADFSQRARIQENS